MSFHHYGMNVLTKVFGLYYSGAYEERNLNSRYYGNQFNCRKAYKERKVLKTYFGRSITA
jgi:hypothetical protein